MPFPAEIPEKQGVKVWYWNSESLRSGCKLPRIDAINSFPTNIQTSAMTQRTSTGRTGATLFGGPPGNMDESITSAEISSILKCPSCYEIPELPITLCANGHNVCSLCRRTNNTCAQDSCDGAFTSIRNFVCETLITKTNFRCKYLELGCEVVVKGNEFHKHINGCQFRPITCNLSPCISKSIVYQTYVQHLRQQHQIPGKAFGNSSSCEVLIPQNLDRLLEKQDEIPGNRGQRTWPSYYITFDGEMFFLNTMVVNNLVYWFVTQFDHAETALGNYRCHLALKSQRSLQVAKWTGIIHSVRVEFDQIKTLTAAVFPLANLKRIFGINQRLSSADSTTNIDEQRVNWNISLAIEAIKHH